MNYHAETWNLVLRFWYSDFKQLPLKAYILTRIWVFRFIFRDRMLNANRLIKYEKQVSLYISMWMCDFSSAKLAHQKSKPVMLLSHVKLVGNVWGQT